MYVERSIGGTKKKLIFTNIRCFSCAYAAFRLWKSFYGGKYRSGSHFSFDTRVNSSRIMRLLQSYRIYEYRTSTHGTQCRSSSTYVRNTRVYIYMYIGKFKIKLFTFAFGLRVCFFFLLFFFGTLRKWRTELNLSFPQRYFSPTIYRICVALQSEFLFYFHFIICV